MVKYTIRGMPFYLDKIMQGGLQHTDVLQANEQRYM